MNYKIAIIELLNEIKDEYSLKRIYKLVEYLYLHKPGN